MTHVLAYLAGLATIPLLWFGIPFLFWAGAKTEATGPCVVCGHGKSNEIGDTLNIVVRARRLVHDLTWAQTQRHRREVASWRDGVAELRELNR